MSLPISKDILLRTNSLANSSDSKWSLNQFFKTFQVKITKLNETEMELDLISINASIANALRRILISEIPTMAIEKVMIYNNTSIIQDEILAHRLGLIPLKANPSLFEYRNKDDEIGSAQDTLEFELKVKCIKNSKNEQGSSVPNDMYINHNVYSKDIKFVPTGGQVFNPSDVGPIHNDILIAKMRPGQEIDLRLHAVKGIGGDHAKFSPVATASYRLMPEIKLLKNIEGEDAELLKKSFSPGVIGIENVDGVKRAKVLNPRYDNGSRNCFRYEEKFENIVQVTRNRHHFIFSIESIGALNPNDLFVDTILYLKEKCRMYIDDTNKN